MLPRLRLPHLDFKVPPHQS